MTGFIHGSALILTGKLDIHFLICHLTGKGVGKGNCGNRTMIKQKTNGHRDDIYISLHLLLLKQKHNNRQPWKIIISRNKSCSHIPFYPYPFLISINTHTAKEMGFSRGRQRIVYCVKTALFFFFFGKMNQNLNLVSRFNSIAVQKFCV